MLDERFRFFRHGREHESGDLLRERRPVGNLFAGYQPPPGVYDEMFSAPGVLAAALARVRRRMNALGRPSWAAAGKQAQRLIRENGVTYNVYGDPAGRDRPWELDAPAAARLPAAEWTDAGRRTGAAGHGC